MSENEYIRLSPEEIGIILMAIDKTISVGGLRLGDFVKIAPLVTKLLEKLPKPESPEQPKEKPFDAQDKPFTTPTPIKKDGGEAN
jgi:hypothetical protein